MIALSSGILKTILLSLMWYYAVSRWSCYTRRKGHGINVTLFHFQMFITGCWHLGIPNKKKAWPTALHISSLPVQ